MKKPFPDETNLTDPLKEIERVRQACYTACISCDAVMDLAIEGATWAERAKAALYTELQKETTADANTIKDYENRAVRRCIARLDSLRPTSGELTDGDKDIIEWCAKVCEETQVAKTGGLKETIWHAAAITRAAEAIRALKTNNVSAPRRSEAEELLLQVAPFISDLNVFPLANRIKAFVEHYKRTDKS